MSRLNGLFVAAGLLVVCAGSARAQQPGAPGAPRPVNLSYLNLLRRDAAPGVNYSSLVRPQLAAQGAIQSLQQQVNSVGQMEAAGVVATDLPITGQPVTFLNTGGYFLNNRVGVRPGYAVPTTRALPTAPARPSGRTR